MPSNRKLHIHNKAYLVSFRCAEGLPLPANPLVLAMILGVFAKAQTKYPIYVCHYVVQPNHIHLLLVTKAPENLSKFVQYVKRELGHYINVMLERRGSNVWSKGYDDPILTASKVLEEIAYIYANPSNDGLVACIEDYAGPSSWEMFRYGKYKVDAKRIIRSDVPVLDLENYPSLKDFRNLTEELTEKSNELHTLEISPYRWKECFEETKDIPDEEIKKLIVERVRKREKENAQLKAENSEGEVVYQSRWQQQNARIDRPWRPKKYQPRMLILSESKEERVRYITWYKDLVKQIGQHQEKVKKGEARYWLPPGFYAPGGETFGSVLPEAFPT